MREKWFFLLALALMVTTSPAGAVTLLVEGFDNSAAPAFSANWGVVDVSGTEGNWSPLQLRFILPEFLQIAPPTWPSLTLIQPRAAKPGFIRPVASTSAP